MDVATLDSEGNIYLAGEAGSPDFPGVSGVPDGCRPTFIYAAPYITRLSADGSSLTATEIPYGLVSFQGFDLQGVLALFDGQGNATVASLRDRRSDQCDAGDRRPERKCRGLQEVRRGFQPAKCVHQRLELCGLSCKDTITASFLPVALNADGSVDSCANPAAVNSTVTFFVNGLGTASTGLKTGAVAASPASALTLPVSVSGDAQFVSAESVPGSSNSVWALKVGVNKTPGQSGPIVPATFTLIIGGVPVRDPCSKTEIGALSYYC